MSISYKVGIMGLDEKAFVPLRDNVTHGVAEGSDSQVTQQIFLNV